MVAAVPDSGEASTCSQVTSGWEAVNIVGSAGPGCACLSSQNHRMALAERDLKDHPFPTLLPWAEPPFTRLGCTGLESFLLSELMLGIVHILHKCRI